MNEDLVDAIDEYNAAVDIRDNPIVTVPTMKPVMEHLVEVHLKKFERVLADCDD